jgi:hypothetical protein
VGIIVVVVDVVVVVVVVEVGSSRSEQRSGALCLCLRQGGGATRVDNELATTLRAVVGCSEMRNSTSSNVGRTFSLRQQSTDRPTRGGGDVWYEGWSSEPAPALEARTTGHPQKIHVLRVVVRFFRRRGRRARKQKHRGRGDRWRARGRKLRRGCIGRAKVRKGTRGRA